MDRIAMVCGSTEAVNDGGARSGRVGGASVAMFSEGCCREATMEASGRPGTCGLGWKFASGCSSEAVRRGERSDE